MPSVVEGTIRFASKSQTGLAKVTHSIPRDAAGPPEHPCRANSLKVDWRSQDHDAQFVDAVGGFTPTVPQELDLFSVVWINHIPLPPGYDNHSNGIRMNKGGVERPNTAPKVANPGVSFAGVESDNVTFPVLSLSGCAEADSRRPVSRQS